MVWNIDQNILPTWAQQLSSILPLSALIEFVDIGSKLHIAQLTGSVPRWQWPVTPVGARLLFAVQAFQECALDHPEQSTPLECFDTRHGDAYPSSTPTTTRLWTASEPVSVSLNNRYLDKQNLGVRPQVLRLYHLRFDHTAAQTAKQRTASKRSICADLIRSLRRPTRWFVLDAFAWLCWLCLIAISLLVRLWFAAAYLLFVVASGLVISNTHGFTPRKPLNCDQYGNYNRLIVATNSRNSAEWSAIFGESVLLNGLLNRPLLRRSASRSPRLSLVLLQVLILCQWITVLAVSSLAGWDAYVVSFWILFCSISSAYLYTPGHAARDWLRRECHVSVRCMQAEFSSRRAMLGALAYLNPDSGRTCWMDTILSKSSTDRGEWEAALLQDIRAPNIARRQAPASVQSQQGLPEYWRKWIAESIDMGEKMKQELRKS